MCEEAILWEPNKTVLPGIIVQTALHHTCKYSWGDITFWTGNLDIVHQYWPIIETSWQIILISIKSCFLLWLQSFWRCDRYYICGSYVVVIDSFLQTFQHRERLLQEAEFQLRSLCWVHEVGLKHIRCCGSLLHDLPYAHIATPTRPRNHPIPHDDHRNTWVT